MKRKDYLNWDEYFMGIALLSAERSKDPHTCVGAVIVAPDNRILSVGYNGMPRGCSDDEFPWERDDPDDMKDKYLYVCHAELNAILNYSGTFLTGSRIYVTLFPCNECTKALIQAGITEIIYYDNKYPDTSSTKASIKMMEAAGVTVRRYERANRNVSIAL